jgi:hypothetical protein
MPCLLPPVFAAKITSGRPSGRILSHWTPASDTGVARSGRPVSGSRGWTISIAYGSADAAAGWRAAGHANGSANETEQYLPHCSAAKPSSNIAACRARPAHGMKRRRVVSSTRWAAVPPNATGYGVSPPSYGTTARCCWTGLASPRGGGRSTWAVGPAGSWICWPLGSARQVASSAWTSIRPMWPWPANLPRSAAWRTWR